MFVRAFGRMDRQSRSKRERACRQGGRPLNARSRPATHAGRARLLRAPARRQRFAVRKVRRVCASHPAPNAGVAGAARRSVRARRAPPGLRRACPGARTPSSCSSSRAASPPTLSLPPRRCWRSRCPRLFGTPRWGAAVQTRPRADNPPCGLHSDRAQPQANLHCGAAHRPHRRGAASVPGVRGVPPAVEQLYFTHVCAPRRDNLALTLRPPARLQCRPASVPPAQDSLAGQQCHRGGGGAVPPGRRVPAPGEPGAARGAPVVPGSAARRADDLGESRAGGPQRQIAPRPCQPLAHDAERPPCAAPGAGGGMRASGVEHGILHFPSSRRPRRPSTRRPLCST
jgi:hypothetical protein